MATPADLKLLAERLSAPPFSKTWTVIQLHDTITPIQLLQCISDVVSNIDQANLQSPHRNVDIRNELPEDTVARLSDFLRMLKFKDAVSNFDELGQNLFELERKTLFSTLLFLVKDFEIHKKRAYLALFLSIPEVPPEFSQDQMIVDLITQISSAQEEFKSSHKWLDGLKQSGNNAAVIKREIQQMEEEKQQVMSKVAKLQKKVEGVANCNQWLEAARNLRMEQQSEAEITERIKDQRMQVTNADQKLNKAIQELKNVKANLTSASPDAFFAKMQEEYKMNRFLSEESLPKTVEEIRSKIRDLSSILAEPAMSESDLTAIEKEISETNLRIAQLAEQKMTKASTSDANLALFRQQAAIISRKKEGAVQRLSALTAELAVLNTQWASKQDQIKQSSGTKMLKGEDFKRYVSELRGKSTNFKRKKAELSELMAEYGILQRTGELLQTKETALQDMIHAIEQKRGVVGFHAAQETLEKVSEKKSEIDQVKGRTLDEISEIIQTLLNTINEKKNMLAPVIQELRQLRQDAQELEINYLEKKRIYDATLIGVESETTKMDQEMKGNRQDIINDQSRYHYINCMHQLAEISQDRVMAEMKSYIGGDEMIELQQKARGFKTYREHYNKKIVEHEHHVKALREQQKKVKAEHEPNMKQIGMFADVCKLLALKYEHNNRVLNGEGQAETGIVTMDRLVL